MALIGMSLIAVSCSPSTGPSVEFKQAATTDAIKSSESPNGVLAVADAELTSLSLDPKLGFIPARGEDPVAMENGGRVPLGDDKIAEVFIAPYPPEWNTDLHLYLLDKDDFKPVEGVDVDLNYEMVWMDHGIDSQIGTKVDDGHYLLPLSFLMYGDWQVDVRMDFGDEGKKHLQFVVKFDPQG